MLQAHFRKETLLHPVLPEGYVLCNSGGRGDGAKMCLRGGGEGAVLDTV